MKEEDVKLIVLETIIDVFERMNCYKEEGDTPLQSFIDEAIDQCRQLRF